MLPTSDKNQEGWSVFFNCFLPLVDILGKLKKYLTNVIGVATSLSAKCSVQQGTFCKAAGRCYSNVITEEIP